MPAPLPIRDDLGPQELRARARRERDGRVGGRLHALAHALDGRSRAEAERVELWFADEARVGQKGRVTHVWYERGVRPRGVRRHRFGSACLFGAVCPERGTGRALVLPEASTAAMALLLAELAAGLPAGTHAVVVLDRAGYHTARDLVVPPNLTLVLLPAYSPELNPVENVWRYLRDRYLSHRTFPTVAAVVDACCVAWNRLVAEPGRLRSLTAFPWLPSCVSSS